MLRPDTLLRALVETFPPISLVIVDPFQLPEPHAPVSTPDAEAEQYRRAQVNALLDSEYANLKQLLSLYAENNEQTKTNVRLVRADAFEFSGAFQNNTVDITFLNAHG